MSRALWVLATLLSHWRRRPMQLATLLIGLISATALWSGVQALNQQARTSYDRAAKMLGGARTPMLVARDGAAFAQKLYVDLRRAGWPVSPMLEGRIQIAGRPLRLVGIEPVTMPADAGPEADIGPGGLQAFVLPPGQTLAAPETLRDYRLAEGAQPETGAGAALPPLKAQASLAPGILVVDIGVAQQVLRMPERVTRLMIGKTARDLPPLESIAGDRLVQIAPDTPSDLERLTDSFHLNLTAFGLLSFVVGVFIVNSAIGLAFEQRLPMLRTLRACGVSTRMLNAMLLLELVSLALIAGGAGLVAGYVIAAALLPDVAASLRGLYGAAVPGQLALPPQWWLAGLAISLCGALAAAAASLLKAARLPVLVSAQPQAWRQAQSRWLKMQGAAALAILAAAGALLFGDSLLTGFGVLAALLLGAALALPVILAAVLAAGERAATRPLPRWFWADSRQQISGLSLALMALLLALAVNVGVGAMVESFRTTFLGWLDGRLAADIYVNARDRAQADDIKAWLRGRPGVDAILPGGRAEVQMSGWPVEMLGLADHATYREQWPLLRSAPRAWDRLHGGDGAMISEQFARRLNVTLGARLVIPTPGGDWPLEIVAVFADYGNPKGQIALDVDALARHFPDAPQTRFGLRAAPDAIAALVDAMRARFQLDERSLADQATLKAESRRIFNRTFAVTAALNAFTLGVAGAALFTSLLTLSHSRLPQLAPLWAIGTDRRRLAALELLKTMAMALMTAILALPLGLLVAWCLIAVVNVRAFGWRLPFQIFPWQLVQLLVVAMIASALAALLPVLKLARMQPAALIRVFSNER